MLVRQQLSNVLRQRVNLLGREVLGDGPPDATRRRRAELGAKEPQESRWRDQDDRPKQVPVLGLIEVVRELAREAILLLVMRRIMVRIAATMRRRVLLFFISSTKTSSSISGRS